MSPSSSVAAYDLDPCSGEHAPARRALRVLAFVEAHGLTGALSNLLEFAASAATRSPRIEVQLATYWRDARADARGDLAAGIEAALDAAAAAGVHSHVLHERFAGDPRLLRQVRDLVRTTSPDIVETHHVKSHFLVAASGAASACRWIAFHHGYTTTSVKTRTHNLLDLWSLTRPMAIVTPCSAFAEQLRRRGIRRNTITVIHSAVKTAPRASADLDVRARLNLDATDRLVLAVGRLSREKAHDLLVTAFSRERLARLPNATLVIAGDGPERNRLVNLAAGLAVGRVQVVGHQTNVWPLYHAADVVALPSDSEGSPLALLEAMAVGKPVVATRVGGIPEILEEDVSGLLVPPRNADALAAALARVLEDPSLASRLGAGARTAVAQRFTYDRRANALSALYQRVATA